MADKKLYDILQGLINTDSGIISKLKQSITDKFNNLEDKIDDLDEKAERGSSSYAIVDINSPGRGGSGSVVTDTLASHGKSIQITTNTGSNLVPITGNFADVKFGHYAICARIKISSKTSSALLQLKLLNGSTEILAANFAGTAFDSTSQYCYVYSTFKYEAINGTKQPLQFQLHTHKVDGVKINFDYVYISMIIPSVFL